MVHMQEVTTWIIRLFNVQGSLLWLGASAIIEVACALLMITFSRIFLVYFHFEIEKKKKKSLTLQNVILFYSV
jgi:hypothetical protein